MDSVSGAIILAGGLGTRLKSISKDTPKPLMPINDKVFLDYPIHQLKKFNINNIFLSVGFNHNLIVDYFKNTELKYIIEEEPLGTGGAIKKALSQISHFENIVILNGDTFFNIDYDKLVELHLKTRSDITIGSKIIQKPYRYGTMEVENSKVIDFKEKKEIEEGVVNCGIYIINKSILKYFPSEEKFSFEKEILENQIQKLKISTLISDSYFIDIGIPEDYNKAISELPQFLK
jgi:D-glycero-alpha-D-manno-heptose 1-phosphate guanylyltransferase